MIRISFTCAYDFFLVQVQCLSIRLHSEFNAEILATRDAFPRARYHVSYVSSLSWYQLMPGIYWLNGFFGSAHVTLVDMCLFVL